MDDAGRFFAQEEPNRGLRVSDASEETIRHEVMFEQGLTSIKHRPLYIGSAYPKHRFIIATIFSLLIACSLIGRAAWMQVWQGSHYEELSAANRLRHIPIWPQRGIIRDRQGKVLADNTTRFQVTIIPRDLLPESDQLDIEIGESARLIGLSVHDLDPFVHATGTARDESILVADQLTYAQAMAFDVASPHLPGFTLSVRPRRRYPLSTEITSLSHVLGYVGRLSPDEYDSHRDQNYRRADEIGKSGLERSYETPLRGTIGERVLEVDSRGREKAMVGNVPAKDGQDLTLALDVDMQRSTETALKDGMRAAQVSRGSAIVMDPRDGAILAVVSLPAYDDNAFSGSVSSTYYAKLISNPDQPLFPRAWAGQYPSGSTVKIVESVGALMEKIITPNTTVLSVGGISVGPWFFADWKAGGHGVTNLRKAIAWSVNTFFYTIGGGYESFVGLGVDKLGDWFRRFGLGAKTGVDLPAEATGFVPTKEWKQQTKSEQWFVGDTYNLSIGQGDLLVTPLQVAAYTSTIANRGIPATPHIVKSSAPEKPKTAIADASYVETVRQGMRDCVAFGSCRALADLSFPVAGKTGTAQWNANKKTHAWFTAFAPFDHPEAVVTVLLEEGGEGSSVSVPVAKNILQAWWDLRAKRGGAF